MVAGEWERYLRVPDALEAYRSCHRRCRASFDTQRENIRRVVEELSPQSVCCLGAGVLNDIPYELLIDDEIDLYLADWLTGSIESGISLSIIHRSDDAHASCIYCQPHISCPEQFCLHFELASRTDEARSPVCDRFVLSEDTPSHCLAFEMGPRPKVFYEDVTGGYATEFGRHITKELRSATSWKQAFSKAEDNAIIVLTFRTTASNW